MPLAALAAPEEGRMHGCTSRARRTARRWPLGAAGALALFALVLLAPLASAGAVEVPLPAGWSKPTDVAFARDGALVVALEGSWALGRIDLASNASQLVPLVDKPASDQDTMWNVRFAPDGAAWTATGAAVHRVVFSRPAQASAFKLPNASQLVGDVFVASDGTVWIAQTDGDRLVHLDPNTAHFEVTNAPASASGPLSFDQTGDGTVFLTATYANNYARFDPATGALRVVEHSGLLGPVGLSHDANGTLWAAEMGASRVSALFPTSATREVYPTTPSPYYAVSGPSGIVVDKDGVVWFAEHFADRVARLDPRNGTLVEYEVPSAPGTNVQRVTLGPDGALWAAEYSRDRLVRVTYGGESFGAWLPARVTMDAGGARDVNVTVSGPIIVATDDANLTVQPLAGKVTLRASAQTPPGDHRVLIATKEGKTTVGQYVIVSVTAAPTKPAPAAPLALALALVVALAFARRRRA